MNEDENSEFLCERRLKEQSEILHRLYRSSIFAIDRLLTNYETIFPFFTNHTFEHSAQVIRYCNIIAGEDNIRQLNADELYILLMGAALHDIGMGISEEDFRETKYRIDGFRKYEAEHPAYAVSDFAREFHQEFSVQFIQKYQTLFEIPSPQHLYGICQIARGHRHSVLASRAEYADFYTPNGNRIRLSYLAALVKLADELDITSDRNLMFDYSRYDERWSEKQILCYQCHKAIRKLSAANDAIVLSFSTEEPTVLREIMDTEEKVQETFREFVRVTDTQPNFHLCRHFVRFEKIP